MIVRDNADLAMAHIGLQHGPKPPMHDQTNNHSAHPNEQPPISITHDSPSPPRREIALQCHQPASINETRCKSSLREQLGSSKTQTHWELATCGRSFRMRVRLRTFYSATAPLMS